MALFYDSRMIYWFIMCAASALNTHAAAALDAIMIGWQIEHALRASA
jgi:hypothetical protein